MSPEPGPCDALENAFSVLFRIEFGVCFEGDAISNRNTSISRI